MRWLVVCLVTTIALMAGATGKLTVVDGDDRSPIAGATLFAKSGIIVGITDKEGRIAIPSDKDFPVTIKCLGYEQASVDKGVGEVALRHSAYTLGEVTVTPVDRPVMRMICYVREYVSGATATDTLMSFNEHVADFFLPTRDKIKGFKKKTTPRFLRSRLYSRTKDSTGTDSIFKPEYRDDTFSWEDLVTIPYKPISPTEAIAAGAKTDSIQGKHGVKEIYRNNGAGSSYIVYSDYLSDKKNHTYSPFLFKLLGLTIDVTELQSTWEYRHKDTGAYTPADIISGTYSISVVGKGKWIKKAANSDSPITLYSFYEIYPLEIEYLTVDEAKELRKNPPRVKITVSPNARPLDPAIQHIVDVCSSGQRSR